MTPAHPSRAETRLFPIHPPAQALFTRQFHPPSPRRYHTRPPRVGQDRLFFISTLPPRARQDGLFSRGTCRIPGPELAGLFPGPITTA